MSNTTAKVIPAKDLRTCPLCSKEMSFRGLASHVKKERAAAEANYLDIEAAHTEALTIEEAAKPKAKAKRTRKLCTLCKLRAPGTGNGTDPDQARRMGYCTPCLTEAEWDNTHSDYGHDSHNDATPEKDSCWVCHPELNEAAKDYVKPERVGHSSPRRPQIDHKACKHVQTPKARRACRKAAWSASEAAAKVSFYRPEEAAKAVQAIQPKPELSEAQQKAYDALKAARKRNQPTEGQQRADDSLKLVGEQVGRNGKGKASKRTQAADHMNKLRQQG